MKHFSLRTLSGFFFLLIVFAQCQMQPQEVEITITNSSDVDLQDKPVSIKPSELPAATMDPAFPLVVSSDGDTVPSQLNDLDGDGSPDELFFVVDLPSGATKTMVFGWTSDTPDYTIRTSARFGKRSSAQTPVEPKLSDTLMAGDLPKSLGYQPYQTDGPSWENDKVGFRHYFDGRNAKDLFGKKAAYMSPETVGINARGAVEDNYHVMEDWGRDVLAVGNSVGIGGYALMANDALMRLGVTVDDSVNNVEKTVFQIVAEGPVKSVLKYHYMKWQPSEREYDVKETTSIWPGMYGYQNSVQFKGLNGDETMVVGLVNINDKEPLEEIVVNDEWVVLMTHDMQSYERQWWLGLAIIVPRNIYLGYTEAPESGQLSNSFLAKLKVENNTPVTYYAVAGWEISDERFKDHDFFRNYLVNLTKELSAKVDVSITTNKE